MGIPSAWMGLEGETDESDGITVATRKSIERKSLKNTN
jgi:hypothetical protein